MPDEKTCTRCGQTKSLDLFDLEPRGRLGRCSRCKACRKAARARPLPPSRGRDGAAGRELRCTNCGEWKPVGDFYAAKLGLDGRRSHCKVCSEAEKDTWEKANPEKSRVRHQRCQRRNAKFYNVKRRHKLTRERFEAMLAAQEGRCAICQKPFGTDPNVDHCHRTGRIRGVLCRRCNGALGSLDDSIPRLEAAIVYLRRFQEEET